MLNPEHICLIGTGKLSRHLAKKLRLYKGKPIYIWGRNSDKSAQIAREFELIHLEDLMQIPMNCVAIFCVSDHAIETLANKLKGIADYMVHLSGTQTIHVLTKYTLNAAVMWPVQSFSFQSHMEWKRIPLVLEVSNTDAKEWLMELVNALGGMPVFLDEESRKKLHLAAVVSNNFLNHLMVLTETWCIENKLDFQLLLPLISQSIANLNDQSPTELQTGPASRNDQTIVQAHLDMLQAHAQLKEVYTLMSSQISENYRI